MLKLLMSWVTQTFAALFAALCIHINFERAQCRGSCLTEERLVSCRLMSEALFSPRQTLKGLTVSYFQAVKGLVRRKR